MAAARYCHGDEFTVDDVDRLQRQPRRPGSVALAADLHERLGDTIHCVAAYDLEIANPTTGGLGDTFVGGFLAAVTRLVVS